MNTRPYLAKVAAPPGGPSKPPRKPPAVVPGRAPAGATAADPMTQMRQEAVFAARRVLRQGPLPGVNVK